MVFPKKDEEQEQRRIEERLRALELKELMEEQGYKYAISLYGTIWNNDKKQHEYRRVEVLSQAPFGPHDIIVIKDFFSLAFTDEEYTIWIWDKERHKLRRARF
jgi:hypothetical protein